MLIIFASWLGLTLCAATVGFVFHRFLSRALADETADWKFFRGVWAGVATVTALASYCSLFTPLGSAAFVTLVLCAVAGLALFSFRVRNGWSSHSFVRPTAFHVLAVVVTVLIAQAASSPMSWYDSYLYHLNMVAWNNAFPAVRGLVHLHARLGFNSSFHVLAAVVDNGPLDRRSAHIVLSFLAWITSLHWLAALGSATTSRRQRAYCLLTLPYLLSKSLSGVEIASLQSDLPMSLALLEFGFAIFDDDLARPVYLAILAALALTFKLSAAPAAIVLGGVAIHAVWKTRPLAKPLIRQYLVAFAAFVFITAGFIARNAIISGWAAYPAPLGNFGFDWSASPESVRAMANLIKAWARKPGVDVNLLHAPFRVWFVPWLLRNRYEVAVLLLPLIFLNGLVLIAFRLAPGWKDGFVAALGLIGVLFVLVLAPDTRYGLVYPVILWSATALPVVVWLTRRWSERRLSQLNAAVAVGLIVWLLPPLVARPPLLTRLPPIQSFALRQAVLSPGLQVWTPVDGDQCGDSPLLCTPYLAPVEVWSPLRGERCATPSLPCSRDTLAATLRRPPDISQGFRGGR